MIQVLVVALQVALAAGEPCHLVTNTQIVVLPSCDLSPATVAQLTADSASSPEPARVGPAGPSRRRSGRGPLPVIVRPLAATELQRRLEASEADRIAAVAQRLAAERERDAAQRARAVAERELEAVRRELAVRGRCAAPATKPATGEVRSTGVATP